MRRKDLCLIRLPLLVDPLLMPLLKPRRVSLSRDKGYIPPQGQTKTYGIYPPQGIKGVVPVAPPIAPPPPPPVTPSTIGTCAYLGPVPQRNVVKIGGYWYAFYHQPSTHYLVYRSSSDGMTWSAEVNASHAAMPTGAYYDMTVFSDGVYLWIAYPAGGAYGSNNVNIFTRRGTPSGGTITWDTQTQIETNRNGYCKFSFAQTTNYVFLAYTYHNGSNYDMRVKRTTTGASWTEIWSTLGYAAQQAGVGLVRRPNYADGLIWIMGFWSESSYYYYAYNGTSVDASGSVGEKTGNAYVNVDSFSLCYANGEVHFVYLPSSSGGVLRYRYWTTGWSGYTTIDSSTVLGPALSGASTKLYCFHIHSGGTDILYRSMVYATHTWDGADSTLASGETAPWYVNSDQYPPSGERIGASWISGTSMRFMSLAV